MAKLLLIEPSATRRRALVAMLQTKGHEVLAQASYVEGLAVVSLGPEHHPVDLVVISWPEYADQRATNIFQNLKNGDWRKTPVLIMADSTDAGGVSWLMKRPTTSLLMWSDYSDAPEAVTKLLSPKEELQTQANEGPGSLRILFVDDSPTVRVAFRRLLLAEGYQVEVASSAEEGLVKALAADFDIAIIDYFMPGDNGAGMVRNLKDHEKTRGIIA
jgi:CheY-like chemotaxis protein